VHVQEMNLVTVTTYFRNNQDYIFAGRSDMLLELITFEMSWSCLQWWRWRLYRTLEGKDNCRFA